MERRAGDRRAAAGQKPAASGPDLYDPVTGFASKTLFRDRGAQALNRATRTETKVALLILELERTSRVASQGELKEIAGQLLPAMRPHDTAAWLDEDHLGVLAEDVRGVIDADDIRLRLERSVRGCTASSVAISDARGRMGHWMGGTSS